MALAMRWIIEAARKRSTKTQWLTVLPMSLLDASNERGSAIKKRDDTHKNGEANKAFAHLVDGSWPGNNFS